MIVGMVEVGRVSTMYTLQIQIEDANDVRGLITVIELLQKGEKAQVLAGDVALTLQWLFGQCHSYFDANGSPFNNEGERAFLARQARLLADAIEKLED